MMHDGIRFGHRVWCSIVVDPKEVLCQREGATEVTIDLTMLNIDSEGENDDNNNDYSDTHDVSERVSHLEARLLIVLEYFWQMVVILVYL